MEGRQNPKKGWKDQVFFFFFYGFIIITVFIHSKNIFLLKLFSFLKEACVGNYDTNIESTIVCTPAALLFQIRQQKTLACC